jgi:DNA-binding transcriptional MerR regulator
MNLKIKSAYKTIGEVAKELGLVDKNNGTLQTHTIRYWETQFKQLKPSIRAGKRRYYSENNLKMIKYIKFLLKDKGLTINGVKKLLNRSKTEYLDDDVNIGINTSNKNTKIIKDKIKKISNIINELKKLK